MRLFGCFLTFLIMLSSSVSGQPTVQPQDSLILDTQSDLNDSIVLLKNQGDIVPVQGLDKLSIATINLTMDADSILSERINSYAHATSFDWDDMSASDGTLQIIRGYNFFIIVIDDSFHETIKLSNLVSRLGTEVKVALLVAGNAEAASESFSNQYADVVMWSDESAPQAYDDMVQVLFGGAIVQNFLEESISNSLSVGMGLPSDEKVRLSYGWTDVPGLSESEFNDGISSIAQQGIDSGAYPGCQILVAHKGQVILQQSYGYHTYDKTRPVRNTDLYDIASVTKVTAATLALMGLHDDGKLELDVPMSTYWPRFNKTNKAGLSVRSILAHQARLQAWIPYYKESQKKNGSYKGKTIREDSSKRYPYRVATGLYLHEDYRLKKLYKMIDKSPLNKEPGYVYSGLSFYLYPEIVKNLTGLEFSDFLQKEYYQPLGATTVGFNPYRRYALTRIVPTEQDGFFRKELLHGQVHDEGAAMMLGVSGNAGLFANANDLAKVWQMMLNDGTYGGKRYLEAATIKEFTRCQYCDQDNRRGLGFDKPLIEYDSIKSSVAKKASPESFGHSGYTGTLVWVDPVHDLLFIFLSNRVYPTRDNRKLYQLNIRPRIHDFIYNALIRDED